MTLYLDNQWWIQKFWTEDASYIGMRWSKLGSQRHGRISRELLSRLSVTRRPYRLTIWRPKRTSESLMFDRLWGRLGPLDEKSWTPPSTLTCAGKDSHLSSGPSAAIRTIDSLVSVLWMNGKIKCFWRGSRPQFMSKLIGGSYMEGQFPSWKFFLKSDRQWCTFNNQKSVTA